MYVKHGLFGMYAMFDVRRMAIVDCGYLYPPKNAGDYEPHKRQQSYALQNGLPQSPLYATQVECSNLIISPLSLLGYVRSMYSACMSNL